jgi:hypothetical protein
MTNNRIVLESVPEKDRAKNINEIDLSEESTVERALGVYWFIEDDKLGFHINVKNQPPTRGGILSLVSSVYDPLGIASPFCLNCEEYFTKLV